MIESVRRCKVHFRTALLTNSSCASRGEERFEAFSGLFDAVVESAVEGLRKPDPRLSPGVRTTRRVDPSRSVFLDDLGVKFEASAPGLGMATIKVTDPDEALSALEDLLGIDLRGEPVSTTRRVSSANRKLRS